MSSSGLERDRIPPLEEVIADILEAQDRHAAPSLSEIVERYPQYGEELERFFAAQAGIDRVARITREGTSREGPSGEGAFRDETSSSRQRVGDYELLDEIGRGGMGVVYRARHRTLGRVVALKMISGGHLATDADVARFRRETQVVARVDHPNVVPIYEVGEDDGLPFFTTQLIDGGSLRERFDEFHGDHRAAAGLLAEVARAVHEVHHRGILHRDLKPGNILVDGHGRPRITDFGLAKYAREDPVGPGTELSASGAMIGTPHYMSPEQVSGRPVGVASDVYGLGAVLYELLVGRPPFTGSSSYEILRKVLSEEVRSPRSVGADVPRDLEVIALQCLQKNPARRYADALELALDLERFCGGRPVAARPVSATERIWRWSRRNPAAVAILGLLVVLAAGSLVSVIILSHQRNRAVDAERHSEEQLRTALRDEARALRLSGRQGQRHTGMMRLRRAAQIEPDRALRKEAIATLALLDAEVHDVAPARASVTEVTWDASGKRYAHGDVDGCVRVRSLDDDRELLAFEVPDGVAIRMEFHRGGEHLLVSYGSNAVARAGVWRLDTGAQIWDSSDAVRSRSVTLSPVATEVAGTTLESEAFVVDFVTGEERFRVRGRTASRLAFGPDGRFLAATGWRPYVRIVDAASGAVTRVLTHTGPLASVEWSRDGAEVFAGGADHDIHIWDAATGGYRGTLSGHTDAVVAIARVGSWILSGSWDGTLRIWDRRQKRQLLVFPSRTTAHTISDPGSGPCVAFHRDDRISFVTATRGAVLDTLHDDTSVMALDFDGSGRRVVVAAASGVWLRRLGEAQADAYLPFAGTRTAGYDGEGETLWVATREGFFRVPFSGSGAAAAIGPPRRLLARPVKGLSAGTGAIVATVLDSKNHVGEGAALVTPDGATLRELSHPGAHSVSVSADGRWAATATWNFRDILVWDLQRADAEPLRLQEGRFNARVEFSPDGRWLATSTDQATTVWRVGTWERLARFPREDPDTTLPGRIAFAAAADLMAVQSTRKQVTLVRTGTWEELADLLTPATMPIADIALSPDGRHLAVAQGSVFVWDLVRLHEELDRLELAWAPPPAPTAPEAPAPGPLDVRLGFLADPATWPGSVPVTFQHRMRATLDAQLEARPADAEALARRAHLLAHLGELDGAIGDLERLRELDPASPRTASHLARLLAERGDVERDDVDRAGQLAEWARTAAPDNPGHWHSLGVVRYARGEFELAAGAFQEAVRRRGTPDPWDHLYLAMCAERAGDPVGFRLELDRAVASDRWPGWPEGSVAERRILLDVHAIVERAGQRGATASPTASPRR